MGITSATGMTIGATSGTLSISAGSTIGINCTNNSALSLGTVGTSSVGIGSSAITTTVNGALTVASGQLLSASGIGIVGGRTSFGTGGAITISGTAINQNFTYVINTAVAIVLPAATTVNQVITLRSLLGTTTAVSSTSNIWPTGTASFGTSYTLAAYASIILYADGSGGGTWYQLL